MTTRAGPPVIACLSCGGARGRPSSPGSTTAVRAWGSPCAGENSRLFVVRWRRKRTSTQPRLSRASRTSQRMRSRRNSANVCSTTQCGLPSPDPCSAPRLAMTGVTPSPRTRARYVSCSQPRSAWTFGGRRRRPPSVAADRRHRLQHGSGVENERDAAEHCAVIDRPTGARAWPLLRDQRHDPGPEAVVDQPRLWVVRPNVTDNEHRKIKSYRCTRLRCMQH